MFIILNTTVWYQTDSVQHFKTFWDLKILSMPHSMKNRKQRNRFTTNNLERAFVTAKKTP